MTFHCNSLIKKNLSDVSIIGCLVFFGNFIDTHLQLSLLFKLGLKFIFKYLESRNKRVLSQTLSIKPHTNFMHFFLLRRSRSVITNLFKNTLLQYLFTYNGKTLAVESSTRGYFVKKKILYFSKTTHIVRIFSQRRIQEPLQYIRWRAPSLTWQGF